jgi:serine/threonine protein kinase
MFVGLDLKSFLEIARTMLSGGTLISEGLYGCVFTPPLECKNKKKQQFIDESDKLSVSKLITKEYADIEMSASKMIRQIPLWRNYFVVSESICEPALKQTEPDLSLCQPLDNLKLSKMRILSMPYGGEPLNIYRFNIRTFDFMNFVKHFIEAGALLNLFGIVNRDIHNGNILVDKNDIPRIIDFNLALQITKEVSSKQLEHQYNYVTGQEPPDSTLVNAIRFGYNPQTVIDSIINKKPIIKRICNLLAVREYDMRESLESFYNRSKAVKSGNDVAWFQTYWRTIDSWAIGANLVDLISKLTLWPEFSPILRKSKSQLFPVLRGLCAVSPVERIDCVQALNFLDPQNFIIRKYSRTWLSKVGVADIK